MVGRTLRIALLTLAGWAMLFAPGAAAEPPGAVTAPVTPERVAAAIIAPTFGSDGVVVGRSCRDDEVLRADLAMPAGDVPSALVVSARGSSPVDAVDQPRSRDVEAQRSAPTRAPPTD